MVQLKFQCTLILATLRKAYANPNANGSYSKSLICSAQMPFLAMPFMVLDESPTSKRVMQNMTHFQYDYPF